MESTPPHGTFRYRNEKPQHLEADLLRACRQIAVDHLGDAELASELITITKLIGGAYFGDKISGLPGRRRQDLKNAATHAAGLLKAFDRIDPRIRLALLTAHNHQQVEGNGSVDAGFNGSSDSTTTIPSFGVTSERAVAFAQFVANLPLVESNLQAFSNKQVDIPRGAPPIPVSLDWMLDLLARLWCGVGPDRRVSSSRKAGSFDAFVIAFRDAGPIKSLFEVSAIRTAIRRRVTDSSD